MLTVTMPDARRRTCRICRRRDDVVGGISWQGLCPECGRERMHANNDSIHVGEGEWAERRRYGIALREFGPRVALALKQAGVFDPVALDDTISPT